MRPVPDAGNPKDDTTPSLQESAGSGCAERYIGATLEEETSTVSKESTMGGEVDKAAGRAKEAAGDLTGNRDLKGEGAAQEAAGNVKDAGAKAGDKVRDAADSIGEHLKH